MKSYTNIEQSKKLAEFLPLESADMCYLHTHSSDKHHYMTSLISYSECNKLPYIDEYCIPCWSLVALLNLIPKHIKDYNVLRIDINENEFAIWYDEIGYGVNLELPDIEMKEPVDACVEMIEKLHEQNLL